jgi:hypothetical protein
VYLGEDRSAATAKLEQDNQTALDGTLAWKVLAERQKAFGPQEFDHHALLYQMADRYWGQTLSKLRLDFYRSPKLPLLHDGDADLKKALYDAQQTGHLALVNEAGQETEADRPADINLTSSSLTIEHAKTGTDVGGGGDEGTGGQQGAGGQGGTGPGSGGQGPTKGEGPGLPPPPPPPVAEQRVVVSLMGSAFSDPNHQDSAYKLFTALATALDNGQVTFGKFQIEVTVPPAVAEKMDRAATGLGATSSRTDLQ